jgi:hypothetical protein
VGTWTAACHRERASNYVRDPRPEKAPILSLRRIRILSGKRFVTKNGFSFTTPISSDGVANRRPGYCTRSGGVILNMWMPTLSIQNTNAAGNRTLRCRVSFAVELKYHLSQRAFCKNAPETRRRYREIDFLPFDGALEEALVHYDDPHVKRALRVFAMGDLKGRGGLNTFLDVTRAPNNIYKLKPLEQLKRFALPRAIGDLGVIKSLYGFVAAKIYKKGQETTFWIGSARADFCPRATEDMISKAFKRHNAARENGDIVFDYFSDDSILTINGMPFDIDISKCDTSHGRAVFKFLVDSTRTESTNTKLSIVIEGLVKQLCLPITLESPEKLCGNKREKVKFLQADIIDGEPTPGLLSGSTITTGLNNLACELMFESFVSENKKSPLLTPDDIIRAAALVGYLIKVKPVKKFEQIQFLKHSPVIDTFGEVRALLNPGVLIRAYGRIKYDYPGQGSLAARAAPFHAQLFRSMYPMTVCPLIVAAKTVHHTTSKHAVAHMEQDFRVRQLSLSRRPLIITDEAFLLRYGNDVKHADILSFFTMPVGKYASNHSLDTILTADYELKTLGPHYRLADNLTWCR